MLSRRALRRLCKTLQFWTLLSFYGIAVLVKLYFLTICTEVLFTELFRFFTTWFQFDCFWTIIANVSTYCFSSSHLFNDFPTEFHGIDCVLLVALLWLALFWPWKQILDFRWKRLFLIFLANSLGIFAVLSLTNFWTAVAARTCWRHDFISMLSWNFTGGAIRNNLLRAISLQ